MTTEDMDAPAEVPALIEPPRFVGRIRSKMVPLEWPIEFGGKLYESVTVSRMTAKQVSEFVEASRAGSKANLAMFDCPIEVIDALDADDSEAVNAVALDFLPRALRTDGE